MNSKEKFYKYTFSIRWHSYKYFKPQYMLQFLTKNNFLVYHSFAFNKREIFVAVVMEKTLYISVFLKEGFIMTEGNIHYISSRRVNF